MFSSSVLYEILWAILIAYLVGSIPVAVLVSRRRRIDIFKTGTGLPGAANVFRNVGHLDGGVVFVGDVAKGVLAVMAAYKFGLDGEMILIPAAAALAGHWRSVFTRFRGGDGLSALLGITLAVFPVYSLFSIMAGAIVGTIARSTGHHPSLWGGIAGYSVLLIGIPLSEESILMALGVVILATLVLIHGILGHRRRRVISV